ncbi:uncharacterized protein N7482_006055 [Penicillium canariense]|uniref:2EXR domain-containing protein n=1 Tax=Penicillium canariense TaxID=189055 RepID=A0A9W9LMW1_9EURO|nr:uncharacterized protein N7482_006055 [Penicillium canariense]KAJ5167274.1 hypothetical protein N7482_006055 [Penicillium canariense]
MENNNQEFHFFSQLPTELRLAIWRICLPNRVVEIDYPWDEGVNFYPNLPPSHGGSFMFDYLDNTLDGEVYLRERIGALQKLQYGGVVMHLIIVRTTFETAAKTGLFGLLGDAYIQLVDISDEARLNALFDFAEKCESEANGSITISELLGSIEPDNWDAEDFGHVIFSAAVG